MNLSKLKLAEAAFLNRYPGGFKNLELKTIRKKRHNTDQMVALAKESFPTRNFKFPDLIVENMVKTVSRSSVLSRFEKPRFRDFGSALSSAERTLLTEGLGELLHENEQKGFERLLGLLQTRKLAKWSLMTIFQTYYHSQKDVFVKPTTVKSIIEHFELKGLQYRPAPTWEFYKDYRLTLLEMKAAVDPSLSPTNLAFSWFLLLSSHNQVF